MSLVELRREYHRRICEDIIQISPATQGGKEYPNFADGSSKASVAISWGITRYLGHAIDAGRIKGQTVGDIFETYTRDFIQASFDLLQHIRPGKWYYMTDQTEISGFDQYEYLAYLQREIKQDSTLASTMGIDYIVTPDIVVGRWPVSDEELNDFGRVNLINAENPLARHTPLRERNRPDPVPILHASISCKWTIRSDRAQNTRTEALNLIRNRKGRLPHVVAVTAEPLPTRLATLALGTGDLDCVYHFALDELQAAIEDISNEDQFDLLRIMVEGRRLRDISDLPFDRAM